MKKQKLIRRVWIVIQQGESYTFVHSVYSSRKAAEAEVGRMTSTHPQKLAIHCREIDTDNPSEVGMSLPIGKYEQE